MELDVPLQSEQADRERWQLQEELRRALQQARGRTRALLAPLSDRELRLQHSPLLAPLVWDLAHLANYEEQWLVRALGGVRILSSAKETLYDAVANPRALRHQLPLLAPEEAWAYAERVRARALELLFQQRFDSPLTEEGFVYGMVLQHEHQHLETILASIQMMREEPYPLAPPLSASPSSDRTDEEDREVSFEGGPFLRGSTHPFAYDNERPLHVAEVRPFLLQRRLVTLGEYLGFVESGGYQDLRWWSPEGWAWLQSAPAQAPLYWRREGSGRYQRRRFGYWEALPPEEPVQHLCFHEAEAYARWAGARLPTEAEWEFAAKQEPGERGNLWREDRPSPFRPLSAPAGGGVSQLFGDCWEWTASDFRPYPGFRAFPYREYSALFFGPAHRVLRGGSWATHPGAMRASFRNWDFPIRRHIFAGLRLARSGQG